MGSVTQYLVENKEWIFSGIGVLILAAIGRRSTRWLKRLGRWKAGPQPLHSAEGLSDAEREVLAESAQLGDLYILKVDAFGSWLRAGERDFLEETDPAIQARYLQAFESLHGRGLIRHEEGNFYRLTATGFERARQIAEEKKRGGDR